MMNTKTKPNDEVRYTMQKYIQDKYPHHKLECQKCKITSHDGLHSDHAVMSCFIAGQCEILEGRRYSFIGIISGPTPMEVE